MKLQAYDIDEVEPYTHDLGDWYKAEDVDELLSLLNEYLKYKSLDGKKIRQELRQRLQEYVND